MANRGDAATANTIVINTTIGFMHVGGQLTLVFHALTNKSRIGEWLCLFKVSVVLELQHDLMTCESYGAIVIFEEHRHG